MADEFQRWLDSERREFHEMANFQRRFESGNHIATFVIVGVFALFYGLSEFWGGSTYVPTLIRLGANSQDAVHKGEWWRLVTSVFLHAGFLHIFFNSYVLIALGSFFNRLFGTFQFLVLFMFSGIVGSAASILIGHSHVSVGGSGALWGLFGASAAIVIRPSHLLPESLRVRMRKVTIINLLINLSISFLPMVDIWAHLGGGIAGFAIGLAFVQYYERGGPVPWFQTAATVLGLLVPVLVVVCFSFALATGKPWQLVEKPGLSRRSISQLGLSVSVPTLLSSSGEKQTFGQLPYDPMVIAMDVHSAPSLSTDDEIRDYLLNQLKSALKSQGVKLTSAPTIRKISGYWTARARYEQDRSAMLEVWLQLRDGHLIELTALAMPGTPKVLLDSLDQVVGSINAN